jgi:outer membrane protein
MTLVFGLAGVASAQTAPKIGWIDLQRTLQETKAGKAARDKLESEKNAKQKQVNDLKEKLKKQAEDFEKSKSILPPDGIAKRERELQEEFAKLQQTFMQLQQDLARAEAMATRDIQFQAASIVESIAKRDGYTYIVERNEGALMWADPTLDITPEVNKRLDAGEGKKPEDKTPAKTTTKTPAPAKTGK